MRFTPGTALFTLACPVMGVVLISCTPSTQAPMQTNKSLPHADSAPAVPEQAPASEQENEHIRQKLAEKVSFDFSPGVPLQDALDFLAHQLKVKIEVEAAAAELVKDAVPVEDQGFSWLASSALKWFCSPDLAYRIAEGKILICPAASVRGPAKAELGEDAGATPGEKSDQAARSKAANAATEIKLKRKVQMGVHDKKLSEVLSQFETFAGLSFANRTRDIKWKLQNSRTTIVEGEYEYKDLILEMLKPHGMGFEVIDGHVVIGNDKAK